jgi:peptide/nickel transport system permease protein
LKGITLTYFLRRLGIFLLTIWVAATLIYIIPRLAPGDPIAAMVSRMTQQAGYVENSDKIIEGWRKRFGLDDPWYMQYARYLGNLVTFNFGYSIANFPTTVSSIVFRALPWTLGLLAVSITLFFFIGNGLGALMAWKKTPNFVKVLIPASMIFTSVPALLAGLILLYFFAFRFDLLPSIGSYGRGIEPAWNWRFVSSVISHGILPVLSIVIVTFGYWTLGMRGMMVTVEGEDYMTLAQAKGLNPFYSLYRYMIRNAILPQITALALAMGTAVGGQVVVEYIFSYRGMGTAIFTAIRNQDYPVIQGATFVLILTTALAVFIIDMLYPLIDPRISHEGR